MATAVAARAAISLEEVLLEEEKVEEKMEKEQK